MWTTFARQAWQLNPGIAIYLTERFSVPALESEVTRLVRSNPLACVDVPDALNFLVGDRLDPTVRRDLRVRSCLTYRQDIWAQPRLAPRIVVLGSAGHCHLFLRASIPQRPTNPAICASCVGATPCQPYIFLRSSGRSSPTI